MSDDSCPSCGVDFTDHLGLAGTCKALQEANSEAARLRCILNRLCGHMPDEPNGDPSWEPTDPEEIAGWIIRAERLLEESGDLEVMAAQAHGWEEATRRAETAEVARDEARAEAARLRAQVAELLANGVSIHKAAARERAAVVDWLRSSAAAANYASAIGGDEFSTAADAIERGEHIPDEVTDAV